MIAKELPIKNDILIIRMNINVKDKEAWRREERERDSRKRGNVVRKSGQEQQARFTRRQVPHALPWCPKVYPPSLAYRKSIMSSCHGAAA